MEGSADPPKSSVERRMLITTPAACDLDRSPQLAARAGYGLMRKALNPLAGGVWDIRISVDKMSAVAKRSPGQANELAYVVPEVLEYPSAVFQGVRDDAELEWLCYCGVPSCSYDNTGTKRKPHLGEVYLVYVNADRVAYTFRWEKCNLTDVRLPSDWANRFDKRLI